MAMTDAQRRAIAVAEAEARAASQTQTGDEGESWSPANAEFGSIEATDPGFLGNISNRLYDAGKAIGLPVSQMRRDLGALNAGVRGAADIATVGTADEIAAGLGSLTGIGGQSGNYDQNLELQRGLDANDEMNHPAARIAGQLGGGVGLGLLTAPYSLTANLTSKASPIIGRIAAGMGDGGILGGLYGAGSGEGLVGRAIEAGKGASAGAFIGGALPAVSASGAKAYRGVRDWRNAGNIAKEAGVENPNTLRILGDVMDADGTLGAVGRSNMARAGNEAMIADAGPNALDMLDVAIQRGGKGTTIARNAVEGRVNRSAQDFTKTLDDTLGKPEGLTAARTAIRQNSAPARSSAYSDAYKAPIDYADPRGQAIENIVKTRVPHSAITEANALMRAEGHSSKQILARVADDGTVTLEKLPDVRQLDYITRGLREVADQADGAGKLGGTTAKGRAYGNLAQELRGHVKELVPEYGKALETAADPIRRSQAIKIGAKLGSTARDDFSEAVKGMTGPEKTAVLQGFRSRIDDQMAMVQRAVSDGNMDAREAIKGLRELSSRQARTNIEKVLGPTGAQKLFDNIDRVTKSFELRAGVATNSKTAGREAGIRRIDDQTGLGVIGTAARGEAVNAPKKLIQGMTGYTDDYLRKQKDTVYADLARLLTQQGGAGQRVYDGITKLGQTDQATQLMSDRISRALIGTRWSYPAASQLTDRTRSR